jgi:hypothetical protein
VPNESMSSLRARSLEQAAFYTGERHLLREHEHRSDAQPDLQKAANTCPKTFIEYAGAVAELKWLNP